MTQDWNPTDSKEENVLCGVTSSGEARNRQVTGVVTDEQGNIPHDKPMVAFAGGIRLIKGKESACSHFGRGPVMLEWQGANAVAALQSWWQMQGHLAPTATAAERNKS